MPSIELVDKIDQQHRGRYYRGTASNSGGGSPTRGQSSPPKAGTKQEDLIFSVEDGDGASVPSPGTLAGDDYLGLEQELEYRLARRRRNRFVAFSALLCAFLLGVAVHRRRGGNVASSGPSGSGSGIGVGGSSGSGSGSGGSGGGSSKHTHTPTASPTLTPASLWPTATPPPPFNICPPPLTPDERHLNKKNTKKNDKPTPPPLPIFRIGQLRTVPEAPLSQGGHEDGTQEWEYTFSSMDISDDASIIAVGLEDFSSSSSYAVGMVRVFAYSCLEREYKQVGQDLRGRNEFEEFGHKVSSSADGKVLAVSAPQESYQGGNGFVAVYYLDETTGLWSELGGRIENLSSVKSYDRLGHAIDLSDKGETLAVLGVHDTNSYVVRAFQFDYTTKKWKRKGKDLTLTVNYEDGYDFSPQLSLSDDGDELSVTDPEFGAVRYHFHFAMNRWEKQDAKTVTFDDEDYWIDGIDVDDTGNVVAFTAFETQDGSEEDYKTAKIVDFTNGTAREVYVSSYEDYGVDVTVAVSDSGKVAAVVASKIDVDDDEFWSDESVVGAMTIVSNANVDGTWQVVGLDTEVEGMGVPGNFVTLSGDGRIAAVGADNVVALYGIILQDDDAGGGDAVEGGDASTEEAEGGDDSSASSTTTTAATTGAFDLCPPFSGATKAGGHVGDIDDLPKQADQHTLSLAMSSDGSVVAVGIDSYDGEDRGLARVFGWSCDSQSYVQMGQDLLGGEEFDGFGQSVDLSADGQTLVVGANQPPPGKSGYVEVYSFGGADGDGLWNIVGHRLDNVKNTVGDVGREVRISDDGVTVMFSGSIMTESDGYGYDVSFVRVVENVKGEWKSKGDDLIASIAYDEYGSEVHIAQSGDGTVLGVAGSYSAFLAKVYTFDSDKKNWTEQIIPPIKTSEEDDEEDSWDVYYDTYFSGSDIDLNDDGMFVAIAGTKWTDSGEDAIIRVLKKDETTGNWTLSHDPVDFTDDYEPSSVAISSDGTNLAVGINSHTDGLDDQGALFVTRMDDWDQGWNSTGKVDGRAEADWLGSRVSITRDGTLAAASSRTGYVSFFKIG